MVSFSFLSFYPPAALPPGPASDMPLPVAAGDVLQLQCPVALAADMSEVPNLRLGLCRRQPDGSFVLTANDVLPIAYAAADRRLSINVQPAPAVFPAGWTGRHHLCVVHGGSSIRAVSEPVFLHAGPPAATLVLRYRNFNSTTFFDYGTAASFNRLRLPLQAGSPRYGLTELQPDPASGSLVPLYARIDKFYALSSLALSAPQVEALQIALRHDSVELELPGHGLQTVFTQGEVQVDWALPPAPPVAQVRALVRQSEFSLLNADFSIPLFPQG